VRAAIEWQETEICHTIGSGIFLVAKMLAKQQGNLTGGAKRKRLTIQKVDGEAFRKIIGRGLDP